MAGRAACRRCEAHYGSRMKIRSQAGLLLAVSSVWFASSAVAATETYKIDPVHSAVTFKVRHLFSFVTGKFTKFDGTLSIDAEAPEKSTVSATVQTASIDTANPKRDEHLKNQRRQEAGQDSDGDRGGVVRRPVVFRRGMQRLGQAQRAAASGNLRPERTSSTVSV